MLHCELHITCGKLGLYGGIERLQIAYGFNEAGCQLHAK